MPQIPDPSLNLAAAQKYRDASAVTIGAATLRSVDAGATFAKHPTMDNFAALGLAFNGAADELKNGQPSALRQAVGTICQGAFKGAQVPPMANTVALPGAAQARVDDTVAAVRNVRVQFDYDSLAAAGSQVREMHDYLQHADLTGDQQRAALLAIAYGIIAPITQ